MIEFRRLVDPMTIGTGLILTASVATIAYGLAAGKLDLVSFYGIPSMLLAIKGLHIYSADSGGNYNG